MIIAGAWSAHGLTTPTASFGGCAHMRIYRGMHGADACVAVAAALIDRGISAGVASPQAQGAHT
jgi:hypothetical protein